MLDLIVVGGTCVLPSGTMAADIGVKDGRIAVVGSPGTLAEATRLQFTTGAYGFGFQIGRPEGADLWPRRRSGNEGDSSRVSGVGPVGDRVVQPGQFFGFAHRRFASRPHATEVVPTTGDAAVEKTRRAQVWFSLWRIKLGST